MSRGRWYGAGAVAAVAVLAAGAVYVLQRDEPSVRLAFVQRDKVVTTDGKTLVTGRMTGFVALRDGWAASLDGPGDDQGELVIRHGADETRRPFRGLLAPGATDTEFWAASGDRLQRLDERGNELAAAPIDGEKFFLVRGLVDGRVLLGEGEDYWLGVWDPASGTMPVMRDTERGRLLATSAGHVAYGGDGDRKSPLDVDDVRTDAYEPVTWPPPEAPGSAVRGALSPDGRRLAVVWSDASRTGDLYLALPGEPKPRLVMDDVGSGVELAWAADDRLVVVRDAGDERTVWVVDGDDVRESGTYTVPGDVRTVVALPT